LKRGGDRSIERDVLAEPTSKPKVCFKVLKGLRELNLCDSFELLFRGGETERIDVLAEQLYGWVPKEGFRGFDQNADVGKHAEERVEVLDVFLEGFGSDNNVVDKGLGEGERTEKSVVLSLHIARTIFESYNCNIERFLASM